MALKSRETFGSRMGMLLAMAGSAIGLGNIWRFPYMMGKNGGAAFILIYVIMLVVLCLPVMVSEYLIGRRGASNPFSCFDRLAPGSKWRWIGFLAKGAKMYLVSKGVEPNRIYVHSCGSKKPLVPNTSAENRAQNRRVEIKIIK